MKTRDEIIKDFFETRKKRQDARFHNFLEDAKIFSLFIVGIPLATVFWLAFKGIVYSMQKDSFLIGVSFIILVFFYAGIMHDLLNNYLKKNYVKIPEYKQ